MPARAQRPSPPPAVTAAHDHVRRGTDCRRVARTHLPLYGSTRALENTTAPAPAASAVRSTVPRVARIGDAGEDHDQRGPRRSGPRPRSRAKADGRPPRRPAGVTGVGERRQRRSVGVADPDRAWLTLGGSASRPRATARRRARRRAPPSRASADRPAAPRRGRGRSRRGAAATAGAEQRRPGAIARDRRCQPRVDSCCGSWTAQPPHWRGSAARAAATEAGERGRALTAQIGEDLSIHLDCRPGAGPG